VAISSAIVELSVSVIESVANVDSNGVLDDPLGIMEPAGVDPRAIVDAIVNVVPAGVVGGALVVGFGRVIQKTCSVVVETVVVASASVTGEGVVETALVIVTVLDSNFVEYDGDVVETVEPAG